MELLLKSIALLTGILATIIAGHFTGKLLETYVRIPAPPELGDEMDYEKRGGGQALGFLERLLFFFSIWSAAYALAGGWLALKVAAKWAAWQHVVKVPGEITGSVTKDYEIRNQLASRLLGRFLLGTLYNAICGIIGATVAMALWSYLNLN